MKNNFKNCLSFWENKFELNLNLHIFESIEFNLKILRVYGLV